MPNGGSDHCGNCRHNRKVQENASRDERFLKAFCTVRGVPVRHSSYTYCANHYVDEREPIGPMFGALLDHERVPYYGAAPARICTARACAVCGKAGGENAGAEVTHATLGIVRFCGAPHYAQWWKAQHPGVPLKWDCSVPAKAVDEPQAQLELAEAFVASKDYQGAREVLAEVLRSGNPAQRERAQALLGKIRER